MRCPRPARGHANLASLRTSDACSVAQAFLCLRDTHPATQGREVRKITEVGADVGDVTRSEAIGLAVGHRTDLERFLVGLRPLPSSDTIASSGSTPSESTSSGCWAGVAHLGGCRWR